MEVWKDIFGYEGLYQVSDHGRIRGLDRFDRIGRFRNGVILADCNNGNGYKYVSLCKNGDIKHKYIHKLVALHFLRNERNCDEVNHKDEDKGNNRAENLEWCTRVENMNYGTGNIRRKNNTDHRAIGEKLMKKVVQFDLNGIELFAWKSVSAAAVAVNCSATLITMVCRGRRKTARGYRWEFASSE